MTRKYLYVPLGNVVWYESDEPVFRADGTIGYVTMMFIHCDDIDFDSTLINVSQGQEFYCEGTKGEAEGNHIHMEVAWGNIPRDI